MTKVMTAEAVAEAIADGSTITFPGDATILVADNLLAAIEARFKSTGSPRDLRVVQPCHASLSEETGIGRLAHEGLTRCMISSTYPSRFSKAPRVAGLINSNKIEAYILPMGVIYSLLVESGAGRPGLLTEVGLGTAVDPLHGGGKLNEKTVANLVRRMQIDGRDWLFYPRLDIDVALLKATTADEDGNLSMESEPLMLGVLALAIAAKSRGGKVFAQIERIAARGTLHPRSVVVPGALVDGIVLAPDAMQSAASRHDPTLTGELTAPLARAGSLTGPDRVILARAVAELKPNWLVNLGVGLGAELPTLLQENDLLDSVHISTEHGAIGGYPTLPPTFGAHRNPSAIIETTASFNLYTGGCLDATFLGMAEIDEVGDINVSRFGKLIPGCGGFIDITSRTPRVFICANFSGGADVGIDDEKVVIRREGNFKKLRKRVGHITFSGQEALKKGQQIRLITERGTFDLTDDGWILKEIAPGIVPARDLQPMMEFELKMDRNLKLYDHNSLSPAGPSFNRWIRSRLGRTG